jgi:hypothetical protein
MTKLSAGGFGHKEAAKILSTSGVGNDLTLLIVILSVAKDPHICSPSAKGTGIFRFFTSFRMTVGGGDISTGGFTPS